MCDVRPLQLGRWEMLLSEPCCDVREEPEMIVINSIELSCRVEKDIPRCKGLDATSFLLQHIVTMALRLNQVPLCLISVLPILKLSLKNAACSRPLRAFDTVASDQCQSSNYEGDLLYACTHLPTFDRFCLSIEALHLISLTGWIWNLPVDVELYRLQRGGLLLWGSQ